MKVVADNKIPFLAGVLEPFCDVEYYSGAEIAPEHIKDADVLLIRTRTQCNESLLKGSAVKFIATATIGYDHIDTKYCSENGIDWTNAPGCNATAVLQWFACALLRYSKEQNIDLLEKTLGVVGVGNVGKRVVEFAEILGMKVLLNDPPLERSAGSCAFRSLLSLKKECDILTFHVPLNMSGDDKTHHMVDSEFVKSLQSNVILINASRGEVFETTALTEAYTQGKIGALYLDVWEGEPNISKTLLELCDIATPHIAGYSLEGKARGTAAIVQALAVKYKLPLEGWMPELTNGAEENKITIDCASKTMQQVLTEAFEHTYKIEHDDRALREKLNDFELLRSMYAYRREPCAFGITLKNGTLKVLSALRNLGFVVTDLAE